MARAAAFLYNERGKAQALWEADSHLGRAAPALSSGSSSFGPGPCKHLNGAQHVWGSSLPTQGQC